MKYFFLLLGSTFFLYQLSAQSTSQPYWQQQVNYNIAVSLNDKDNTIDALEKIVYTNNSPDTLRFIWFHMWQNSYKNDKTAFSEQLLVNGRTDFYFSEEIDRGYTNRLDFKVDDVTAKIEAHSQHIDILKLLLPKPLPPHQSITIETPFHSKLPYNFSRGGHMGKDYQLTQWYPKPAVYDSKGWHEMPYLDQGEFYSEFGNFEVSITVPDNYLVAATGELKTASEIDLLKKLGKMKFTEQPNYLVEDDVEVNKSFFPAKPIKSVKKVEGITPKKTGNKTLFYAQNNVHDFAWFASKNFLVQYDTLQLNSKIVDCFSFVPKSREGRTADNVHFIKSALKKYSKWVGEYPYNTATVVIGKKNKDDGMEYPTITYINIEDSSWSSSEIISHELGHNWFYGILASNEREHPWMDEGMNSYYDNRKMDESRITDVKALEKLPKKYQKPEYYNPKEPLNMVFNSLIKSNKNIAIDTLSEAYPKAYYGLIVYEKSAYWMKELEHYIDKNVFDSAMKIYYKQWQFKHPYPQDFKKIIEQVSGKNIDNLFAKLYNNEPFYKTEKKQIKFSFLFPLTETSKYNHISIAPTTAYNYYDGVRLGVALHNYQLPLPKFQFVINPGYGTNSKAFNFFGRASYNIYKKKSWLEIATSFQKYTYDDYRFFEADGHSFLNLTRFVPSIKYTIYKNDLCSTERTVFGFKTFYLSQQNLTFLPQDGYYISSTKSYINRLYVTKFDNRILYPYSLNLKIDQTEDLLRLAFTAKQFFNYGKGNDGITTRFFAGKIFYTKSKTYLTQYKNSQYQLNLTGPNGYEDYTFSDYFIGRNEMQRGWRGQQIMERDGFFKVRTDLLGNKIGTTDDWLMALNLNADCPGFPTIKFFLDVGTYADAWNDNSTTGRFLYDAGLQLSLLKNTVNIYFPILNSKDFRDYNQSYVGQNIFLKSISFSININNLQFNKLSRDIPL